MSLIHIYMSTLGGSGSKAIEHINSCKDEKVWCKMADCSLTNVAKSCRKTCGTC